MGLQLIICVETNKKCNSDYIYIKTSIEHFYLTLDDSKSRTTFSAQVPF